MQTQMSRTCASIAVAIALWKDKSDKTMYVKASSLPTVNYFQELCHVGSHNTHWQVSLPQGSLLTLREGQLAQAPDWELTHEVLPW